MARIKRPTAARYARYQMPRRPPAPGTAFVVQNERGEPVLTVRGGPPDSLVFEDLAGREQCTIHEATYGLQPMMRISRRGEPAAWVYKDVMVPVREEYTVDLHGAELRVEGNVLDHEYTVRGGRRIIAAVSLTWVGLPDTYGVEVLDGHGDAVILAATVCLALMSGTAG
jgi:uncharacterized protein YxjI